MCVKERKAVSFKISRHMSVFTFGPLTLNVARVRINIPTKQQPFSYCNLYPDSFFPINGRGEVQQDLWIPQNVLISCEDNTHHIRHTRSVRERMQLNVRLEYHMTSSLHPCKLSMILGYWSLGAVVIKRRKLVSDT